MPDNMETGPELATAIATEVMGFHAKVVSWYGLVFIDKHNSMRWANTWRPDIHWTEAREVLEWVREQDEDFHKEFYAGLFGQWTNWCAEDTMRAMETSTGIWLALHANIPLVICQAALTAVRVVEMKKANG